MSFTLNYQKRDNAIFHLKPGDYVLEVIAHEKRFKGEIGQLKVNFREVNSGARISEMFTFSEDCAWKIDTFITAAGLASDKGEIEFTDSFCEAMKGARCWAFIGEQPGFKDPTRKYNCIVKFYTDKEVPPRAAKEPTKEISHGALYREAPTPAEGLKIDLGDIEKATAVLAKAAADGKLDF
jgi:hypothetical protein